MGRMDYLAMKTDEDTNKLINEDFNELKLAAKKLFDHATKLGGLGFGTSFLKWFASFAAIYLLILDRTNWKTNMLTGLLVPYIFFSFPSVLFHLFRGEVGKWIAFVAVVLRLFFPRHFPDVMNAILAILEIIYKFLKKLQHSHLGTITRIVFEILLSFDWLEMPGSLILLLVVAPSLFAETIRNSWIGTVVCLLIGCYLLQEHIRASGGFRNSFTQSNGISNTVGIILLLVYPIWALVLRVV